MRTDWPEQRLYRLIFEHSSDAIVVLDDDGRVLLMNRAARALPGVDVDALFRWSIERDHDLTSFRAQLRVGGKACGEIRVPNAEGQARWFSLEGRAHGPLYAVVLRDVTERHARDEEVKHLRRLESIGFLTASVVHDFNNVLTAMVCSASVLSHMLDADDARAALAESIMSAGDRATGLVRRVLRVLRREPSPPERVNLNAALEEARSLVEMVAGKSITVKMELDPALADTVLDREQLDQVLLNLAANARDAMRGGGQLTIATSNVPRGEHEAGGECDPAGDYVALTVTDTGEGMTPEARERVFERFFTTKDAGEGTGLGLAAAHRFVTQSGGCISVRSAPGQGTTVLVYLPRATPIAQVIQLKAKEPEAPGGRETIVVVECDDHVRFVVRAALVGRGYRVIDAPSGELALRLVELGQVKVSLVLADVGTAGMRGSAVVDALRAAGHDARLLLMSGLTDREIAEHGAAGAPLLRKAFTPNELARRVREVLDGAASRPMASMRSQGG